MSERHITDEEIHGASGKAPRVPPGIPHATCLACGEDHPAFYAAQGHECRIEFTERRTYAEWLILFQILGYGVLRTPEAAKFPRFDYECSGRQMLTFHLQADLFIGPGYELRDDWYHTEVWDTAGFPPSVTPSEVSGGVRTP